VYPGPLGIPEKVPADSPPAFLVAANDDPCCAISTLNVLVRYREAKRLLRHILYSKGDHAFNMGNRSPLKSIQGWPQGCLIGWEIMDIGEIDLVLFQIYSFNNFQTSS
jgi:hypothetical protein